jgi:hypothetical protein
MPDCCRRDQHISVAENHRYLLSQSILSAALPVENPNLARSAPINGIGKRFFTVIFNWL